MTTQTARDRRPERTPDYVSEDPRALGPVADAAVLVGLYVIVGGAEVVGLVRRTTARLFARDRA